MLNECTFPCQCYFAMVRGTLSQAMRVKQMSSTLVEIANYEKILTYQRSPKYVEELFYILFNGFE